VPLDVTHPLDESESDAVRTALAAAGVSLQQHPAAYDSLWRRAAAREAVDAELSVDALGALASQDPGRDAGVIES
jgi:hypothetical protein